MHDLPPGNNADPAMMGPRDLELIIFLCRTSFPLLHLDKITNSPCFSEDRREFGSTYCGSHIDLADPNRCLGVGDLYLLVWCHGKWGFFPPWGIEVRAPGRALCSVGNRVYLLGPRRRTFGGETILLSIHLTTDNHCSKE